MAGKADRGLSGLVLCGGRSRRMGRDKAALPYGGRTQLERVLALAAEKCGRLFLSLRSDQPIPKEAEVFRAKAVFDAYEEKGPLGGILSAFLKHSDFPWLVLAVDLPFLNRKTLSRLISNRDSTKPFTAFKSSHDGLPEPLCAIYEPSSFLILKNAFKRGILCPRKILIASDTHLLDLPDPIALDNVNTAEEYRKAASRLRLGKSGPREN